MLDNREPSVLETIESVASRGRQFARNARGLEFSSHMDRNADGVPRTFKETSVTLRSRERNNLDQPGYPSNRATSSWKVSVGVSYFSRRTSLRNSSRLGTKRVRSYVGTCFKDRKALESFEGHRSHRLDSLSSVHESRSKWIYRYKFRERATRYPRGGI